MFFLKLIYNQRFVLSGIIALCVTALASAYIAQYVFELQPCDLCKLQRIPFWVAIALAISGLLWRRFDAYFIAACGFVFAFNAALAFHHVGVEQHWWKSILESCSFSAQSISEMVSKPAVRCDEVPWIDPIFGMSMAFYNIILCACAAIGCAISTLSISARQK